MNDQDKHIKEMEEKISMLQAEIQILIDRITKIETAADNDTDRRLNAIFGLN